jgi:hypothetical protein
MSLAAMAVLVTAYPINSWMVARGIKHGMMSAPSPGQKSSQAPGHEHAMAKGAMNHQTGSMGHQAAQLTWPKAIGIFLLTFTCLAAAVWITSWFAELRFS